MYLPTISGLIRRRILVNFRVDPDVIQPLLPAPFRPKLLGDAAVAGICLPRLIILCYCPVSPTARSAAAISAWRLATSSPIGGPWNRPRSKPNQTMPVTIRKPTVM